MSGGSNPADRAYQVVVTGLALLLPAVLLALIIELAVNAWPAIRRFGWGFVTSSTWDPVAEVYGAGPLIFGTLASSLVALVLAVPLAFSVAIFLNEFALAVPSAKTDGPMNSPRNETPYSAAFPMQP